MAVMIKKLLEYFLKTISLLLQRMAHFYTIPIEKTTLYSSRNHALEYCFSGGLHSSQYRPTDTGLVAYIIGLNMENEP